MLHELEIYDFEMGVAHLILDWLGYRENNILATILNMKLVPPGAKTENVIGP